MKLAYLQNRLAQQQKNDLPNLSNHLSRKGQFMSVDTQITPQLLVIREVASYLAVSERTVWSLIKSGRLQAVRFGRITRIDKNDVDAFIQAAKGVA